MFVPGKHLYVGNQHVLHLRRQFELFLQDFLPHIFLRKPDIFYGNDDNIGESLNKVKMLYRGTDTLSFFVYIADQDECKRQVVVINGNDDIGRLQG